MIITEETGVRSPERAVFLSHSHSHIKIRCHCVCLFTHMFLYLPQSVLIDFAIIMFSQNRMEKRLAISMRQAVSVVLCNYLCSYVSPVASIGVWKRRARQWLSH